MVTPESSTSPTSTVLPKPMVKWKTMPYSDWNTGFKNRKRDTDVQNRLWDSVGEGEGGMFWENNIETSILSRVKQITSPGWMHETNAQGRCTGKTQRDQMGKEAGGGLGWGTHVNPWLIHVSVWQKPLQYCKVVSLQLMKINEKERKKIQALVQIPDFQPSTQVSLEQFLFFPKAYFSQL